MYTETQKLRTGNRNIENLEQVKHRKLRTRKQKHRKLRTGKQK